MDTLACHAHQDKSLMDSETNATKLQNVTVQEKSLVLLLTAINAEIAQIILSQMPVGEDVLDQSQLVDVPKDTQLTVMSVLTAPTDKSETQVRTTLRNAFHNNATNQTKSSHQETTATDVMSAHQDTSQMQEEMTVKESSQNVAALNSMIAVVMSACHAQPTKLLPTVTKDVSQDNAQESTKSLVQLISAMLVKTAKRVLHQIT
jgi:hypothetical protein